MFDYQKLNDKFRETIKTIAVPVGVVIGTLGAVVVASKMKQPSFTTEETEEILQENGIKTSPV